MGPEGDKTQGDCPPEKAGEIFAKALELGVNFWDTSDNYGTHPHIAEGLRRVPRERVVIADKTNAFSLEEGREAIKQSLKDLGTSYLDIMFLHVVPPETVRRTDARGNPYFSKALPERRGALDAFLEAKDSGLIKTIALSTHSTKVLNQVNEYPEIDIVCTPLNKAGTHIDYGSIADRVEALKALHKAGKGIYVIKILDAGKLRDEAEAAIRYALQFQDFIDAWNIGMYDLTDVEKNIRLFNDLLS